MFECVENHTGEGLFVDSGCRQRARAGVRLRGVALCGVRPSTAGGGAGDGGGNGRRKGGKSRYGSGKTRKMRDGGRVESPQRREGEGQGGGVERRPAKRHPPPAAAGPPAFAKATGFVALGSCSMGCERIDRPPSCAKSSPIRGLLAGRLCPLVVVCVVRHAIDPSLPHPSKQAERPPGWRGCVDGWSLALVARVGYRDSRTCSIPCAGWWCRTGRCAWEGARDMFCVIVASALGCGRQPRARNGPTDVGPMKRSTERGSEGGRRGER